MAATYAWTPPGSGTGKVTFTYPRNRADEFWLSRHIRAWSDEPESRYQYRSPGHNVLHHHL